jgi:hypothetical protein
MRLRINGRCLFKTETVASHGCGSVERQQRNRIEISLNLPCQWDHWLAQALSFARKARFHFPQATPCRIRRRLFLAWLPVALPDAPDKSAILAKQDFTKRGTGSLDNTPVAQSRLAGAPTLATFIKEFRFCRTQDEIRIEDWRPMTQNCSAEL